MEHTSILENTDRRSGPEEVWGFAKTRITRTTSRICCAILRNSVQIIVLPTFEYDIQNIRGVFVCFQTHKIQWTISQCNYITLLRTHCSESVTKFFIKHSHYYNEQLFLNSYIYFTPFNRLISGFYYCTLSSKNEIIK